MLQEVKFEELIEYSNQRTISEMQSNKSCMKGSITSNDKTKYGGNGSLQSTPFKMMLVLLLVALMLVQTTVAA